MAVSTLVIGFGVTGEAVARHADAGTVVAVEDRPDDAKRERAAALGVTLVEAPDEVALAALVRKAELVLPSPGVPLSHPIYRVAEQSGAEVVSEVELAARRARVPIVAITGTNGKTTVTTLVAAMLVASGSRAVAAGNIGLPLLDAVASDAEVIVAEVSSFQLAFTRTFAPHVATWLNLAEDHLDWHPSMRHYADAKARIWANQTPGDIAVANRDDPAVMAAAATAPAAVVTFGGGEGDYRVSNGFLVAPAGNQIAALDELPRRLPHDIANALAATASAISAGATMASCRRTLLGFEGLPHRVTLVREAGGIRYFDDSKATTPASVLAALEGFESAVLIAGGMNKGLDLGVLATAASHIRAVVAIGDAAPAVEAAFRGLRPVTRAGSMTQAVMQAKEAACQGDAVLLSPGCASFDWYSSYAERGDDFVQAVRTLVEG
ncbi:MAG: UDP-N-acetylmuramoylalanine--D-glutamate ligase [Acidimicrobiaceae bacterium]|nr:UDP-N-acetylmuramoylalanine--D-glutamate ligase [Acidimicrobiaceae bacterium]